MDVVAVKAAGDKAVAWCRAGKGPYILEMKTYRYRGHSMSDPAKYRTKEEVNKMRQEHDPIDSLRHLLLERKVDEEALQKVDREVRSEERRVGKSVSVRVDLGGRRLSQQKKSTTQHKSHKNPTHKNTTNKTH